MGNYRFRLSDMIPNAWFYKLKNMSKTSPHNNNTNSSPNPFKHKKMHPTPTTTISSSPSHHQTLQPRKSYYFTREQHTPSPLKQDYLPNSPINPKISDVPFPESPRKSTKRRSSRRRRRRNNIKSSSSSSSATTTTTTTKFVNSSVSAGCSCRATLESVWVTKSDSIPYYSSPFYSVSPPPHHQCSPDEFDSNRNEATTDISEGGGPASSWSSTTTTTATTCSGRISSSTTDIIIDVDSKKSSSSFSPTTEKFEKVYEFDTISEIELPPILTKPQKYINKEKKETTQPMTKPPLPRRSSSNGESSSLLSVKVSKKETMKSNNALKEQKISPMMNRRCSSTGSPGLKRRANSPKIFGSRKIQACSKKTTMSSGTTASSSSSSLMRSTRKKNLSDSFAIIKSSLDPQRDFKESMVEMIVENNLRASKDLEELLACYLSLNSNEYHDLIVDVFQQIWLELTDIRL